MKSKHLRKLLNRIKCKVFKTLRILKYLSDLNIEINVWGNSHSGANNPSDCNIWSDN